MDDQEIVRQLDPHDLQDHAAVVLTDPQSSSRSPSAGNRSGSPALFMAAMMCALPMRLLRADRVSLTFRTCYYCTAITETQATRGPTAAAAFFVARRQRVQPGAAAPIARATGSNTRPLFRPGELG